MTEEEVLKKLGLAPKTDSVEPAPTPVPPLPPTHQHHKATQMVTAELQAKDIKAMAQEASPFALQQLHQIINDPDTKPAVKIAAIKEMLDRGYGKAVQQQEVTVTHKGTAERLRKAMVGVNKAIDVEEIE